MRRMRRLIAAIVRHGDYRQLRDTPSAHQPFPLTDKGEAQAREAGAAIREMLQENGWRLISSIDCSNLLRAWQTAQILRDELTKSLSQTLELNSFDDLAERGLGSANNLSIAQIEAVICADPRFPALPDGWKTESSFRLPLQGAESLLDAGKRVAEHMTARMNALADISESDSLKLYVGHGAALRHAAFHLGILEYAQIPKLSMHHARPIYLEYLGDSWRQLGGAWKIRDDNTEIAD